MDPTGLRTVSIEGARRGRRVVADFAKVHSSGRQPAGFAAPHSAGDDFRAAVAAPLRRESALQITLGMGVRIFAIECGLCADSRRPDAAGIGHGFAMNGSASIHDFETVPAGTRARTEAALPDGFGLRGRVANELGDSRLLRRTDCLGDRRAGWRSRRCRDRRVFTAAERVPHERRRMVHVAIGPGYTPYSSGGGWRRSGGESCDFHWLRFWFFGLDEGGVYLQCGVSSGDARVFLAVFATR